VIGTVRGNGVLATATEIEIEIEIEITTGRGTGTETETEIAVIDSTRDHILLAKIQDFPIVITGEKTIVLYHPVVKMVVFDYLLLPSPDIRVQRQAQETRRPQTKVRPSRDPTIIPCPSANPPRTRPFRSHLLADYKTTFHAEPTPGQG
jgi:hypothetical protein